MRTASRAAFGLLLSIGTARAANQEHIGSWVLSCPSKTTGSEPCLLRLEKRFVDKGGITGDLEIQALGKSLVPVLVLRGVPTELLIAASLAGKADASLQFNGGPRQNLTCAPSSVGYICAPDKDTAIKLTSGLPSARSVTVRVSVSVPGLKPLPVREKSLDLTGTNEALTRLRSVGPSQVPSGPITALSTQSPGALMAIADKTLKAAGYSNGLADLQGLLTKYRAK
jgi:hypothetical protein